MAAPLSLQQQTSPVEEWALAAQERISDAIKDHGRAALPFSGSLTGCLLLHLATPWQSQITVITLRTGSDFPHMVDFADRVLAGWNHKLVQTDIRASFKDFGLPSNELQTVVPGISSALDCCTRNRGAPGRRAVREENIRLMIFDEIGSDWNGLRSTFEGIHQIAPIKGHSRSEVLEMIAARGVELPDHYPEFDAAHGCSVCPVALTPSRLGWMAALYPSELEEAVSNQDAEIRAVRSAMIQQNRPSSKIIALNQDFN